MKTIGHTLGDLTVGKKPSKSESKMITKTSNAAIMQKLQDVTVDNKIDRKDPLPDCRVNDWVLIQESDSVPAQYRLVLITNVHENDTSKTFNKYTYYGSYSTEDAEAGFGAPIRHTSFKADEIIAIFGRAPNWKVVYQLYAAAVNNSYQTVEIKS